MLEKWVASKLFQTEDWVFGITINRNTNILYFTTGETGELWQFDLHNDNSKPVQLPFTSSLETSNLAGVVWDGLSSLYACDYIGDRIIRYDINTTNMTIIPGNIKDPSNIQMCPKGHLYITENEFIRKVNLIEGTVTSVAQHPIVKELSGWVDVYPMKDSIFMAHHNHSIHQLKDGIVSVIAGSPGVKGLKDGKEALLTDVCGLTLLKDQRTLLFVDDASIRSIDLCQDYEVSTLRLQPLNNPQFLTMDAEGNVTLENMMESQSCKIYGNGKDCYGLDT